jgi:predicted HD phosphohydrolase
MSDFITQENEGGEIEFILQFLSCSSEKLTKTERQKIVRKHKSSSYKRTKCDKDKQYYANLEPARKRKRIEKESQKVSLHYRSMGHVEKKLFLDAQVKKYKSMDSEKKKTFQKTKAENQTP